MSWSIRQAARVSGLTARTLYSYDEIGVMNSNSITLVHGLNAAQRRVAVTATTCTAAHLMAG